MWGRLVSMVVCSRILLGFVIFEQNTKWVNRACLDGSNDCCGVAVIGGCKIKITATVLLICGGSTGCCVVSTDR